MNKINKTQARKFFNQGIEVTILPHKANPCSPWFQGSKYSQNDGDFDNIVTQVTHYNCNSELGYYPAYYID